MLAAKITATSKAGLPSSSVYRPALRIELSLTSMYATEVTSRPVRRTGSACAAPEAAAVPTPPSARPPAPASSDLRLMVAMGSPPGTGVSVIARGRGASSHGCDRSYLSGYAQLGVRLVRPRGCPPGRRD